MSISVSPVKSSMTPVKQLWSISRPFLSFFQSFSHSDSNSQRHPVSLLFHLSHLHTQTLLANQPPAIWIEPGWMVETKSVRTEWDTGLYITSASIDMRFPQSFECCFIPVSAESQIKNIWQACWFATANIHNNKSISEHMVPSIFRAYY